MTDVPLPKERSFGLGHASGWTTAAGANDTWNWHAYGPGGSRSGSCDTEPEALETAQVAVRELTNEQGER